MDTQTAQKLYDILIKLANSAYKNSQELIEFPVSFQYLGKSEAFESAAAFVNTATDGQLITQTTERQKDINQGRDEDSRAEAAYEINEIEK